MDEIANVAKITGRVFEGATEPPAGIVATVGLIVLSTDEIGADAFTFLVPRVFRILVTRTAYLDDDPITGEFRVRVPTRLSPMSFQATADWTSWRLVALPPLSRRARSGY